MKMAANGRHLCLWRPLCCSRGALCVFEWLEAAQRFGVVAQMFIDETGDEVIAVVVTGVSTQQQCLSSFSTSLVEQLGLQLRLQEWIGIALIDQDAAGKRLTSHQFAGVVVGP